MARVAATLDDQAQPDHTGRIVMAAAIIGALYFGSEILVPIALAILLSFALAPAVKVLQKLGLGRILPVLITVLFTFVIVAGLATVIAGQARDLSAELPRYEGTVVGKLETIRGLTNSAGMRRIEDAVTQFSHAIGRSAENAAAETAGKDLVAEPTAGQTGAGKGPVLVQVVQPEMRPLQAIMLVSTPLLHPLATAFVVVIFVIFILLQREDLRNRAIRLFGANDLQRTTAAINDGGKRLSRYLLTQCAVNACAGVIVGLVLWMVGVPSPMLLGILFACARFIPYIGPVIGSVLPLVLATAVDPGWTMVIWTAATLAAVEVLVGQLVEPFAYGHNTGLSPIAIVVAATFWTVLWGPIGLLLSTPLTVCLVVLGRHVETLAFLDVLLGDSPPLTPAEVFYQRMLANDPAEAADQAQRCLGEMSITQYYDDVALPALIMAQDDAVQGRLDTERQNRIKAAALEVVEDLGHDEDGGAGLLRPGRKGDAESRKATPDDLVPERVPEALRGPGSVLVIGARSPLDDAAAAMLAQVFTAHGIGAASETFGRLSKADLPSLDVSRARMVVLSSLEGSSPAFLRFVVRRVRRHAPHVEIVVGTWWRRTGPQETDAAIDDAIHQTKVTTFHDAVRHCFAGKAMAPESAPTAGAPVLAVAS